MATFVELDVNNKVINIFKVRNEDCNGGNYPESEASGIEYLNQTFGPGRIWKQASINGNFRKNRPELGFEFNADLDGFIPLKPSWQTDFVLDPVNCIWVPPVPRPDNVVPYKWNPQTKAWVAVPQPYPSWIIELCKTAYGEIPQWVPPFLPPQDGNKYKWDEATTSWIQI